MSFSSNEEMELSEVESSDAIFLMDEEMPKSNNVEYTVPDISQYIYPSTCKNLTTGFISSNSSSQSLMSSRASSRLDSLTSGSTSQLSSHLSIRQCFTPSPYFWPQPVTPILPKQEEKYGISLSFNDLFEFDRSESEHSKSLTESESESTADIVYSKEDEQKTIETLMGRRRFMNAPMTKEELEELARKPGRPITSSMFDSSDDEDMVNSHPFEI